MATVRRVGVNRLLVAAEAEAVVMVVVVVLAVAVVASTLMVGTTPAST